MTESAPASTIRDGILSTFPPSRLDDPLVQGMAEHLAAAVGADSLGHRLQSWIALIDWARSGSNADSAWLERQGAMVGGPYARWRLLFDYLGSAPEVRTGLQRAVAEIMAETEGENLFGDAGLPGERGFLAELTDRLVDKILPAPLDEHDLSRTARANISHRGASRAFRADATGDLRPDGGVVVAARSAGHVGRSAGRLRRRVAPACHPRAGPGPRREAAHAQPAHARG